MADLNHNGILDEDETRDYKERAVNAKFGQQLSYGIGAAMVFGLVGALSSSLLTAVETAGGFGAAFGAAAIPVLGLVTLGIAWIGLLYVSAKLLSENTLRDQAMQAKQINAAGKSKPKEIAVEPTPEKPAPVFPAMQSAVAADKPRPTVSNRALLDRQPVHAAASDKNAPAKTDASWVDRSAHANDNAEKVRA